MIPCSIIIPTLNETENVIPLLQALADQAMQDGFQPEIIFVDDGSSDGTRERIQGYSGPLTVRLVCRDSERGLASAVLAGAQIASQDFVVVMDADLSHPLKTLPLLLAPLVADSCDMVIGSRYTAGGSTPGWPLIRLLGSKVVSFPACLITATQDPLGGFFATHRHHILERSGNIPGFKIALDVLARGKDPLRVQEIPIAFSDRRQGVSKMTSGILLDYLDQLAGLFGLKSPEISWLLFFLLTFVAGVIDTALFTALKHYGWSTGSGLAAGYLTVLCCFLHAIFLLRKKNRTLAGWLDIPSSWAAGMILTGFVLRIALVGGSLISTTLAITIADTFSLFALTCVSEKQIAALRPPVRQRVIIISMVACVLTVKLCFLGRVELLTEEAYYWNYAQHLDTGYLDHPPMIAVLIWMGTALFGNSELGVRFFPFLCWFATAWFSYLFTRSVADKNSAVNVFTLLATLPIYFSTGFFATPDAPLFACWSATIYFVSKALLKDQTSAWYATGVSLGLGLCSKYSIVFLGPAIILFMLFDRRARSWFLRPQPYLAAGIALAIFSPVILWNYQHHWASFLFQSQQRLADVSQFAAGTLLASIFLILTPTGGLAVINSLGSLIPSIFRKRSAITSDIRNDLFCLLLTFIPFLIVLTFSLTKEIKMNWTGPIWLALFPCIAIGLTARQGQIRTFIQRLWPATFFIALLCYAVFFIYVVTGLPGMASFPTSYPAGWQDLAVQINQQVRETAVKTGQRPIVVATDNYQTASALAFYRQKTSPDRTIPFIDETSGRHLFSYPALMYSYWHPPEIFRNRDILVVSKDAHLLIAAFYQNGYRFLGDITELAAKQQGKAPGIFFTRLVFGYRPEASQKIEKKENNQ